MKFKRNHPPAMSPTLGMVPYMSPKDKLAMFSRTFYAIGGEPEFVNFCRDNREWFYDKCLLRDVPRATAIEHTATTSLETLLERLDKGDGAKVINADFTEVADAIDQERQ